MNRIYSKETPVYTDAHVCSLPPIHSPGEDNRRRCSVRSGLLNPEEGVCLLCFINALFENVNNYSDPGLDVQKLKISRVFLKFALQPPGT